MKNVAVSVAFALAVLTSNNAVADGIDRRYPPTIAAPQPYIAPPTWTGFYLGAGIGAGVVLQDIEFSTPLGSAQVDSLGADGVFGTVIAGFDWQIGSTTVFGLFADYDFTGNSRSDSSDFGFSHQLDHVWAAGARLGVLANPGALWYLNGGYTEARVDHRFGDGDFSFSREKTFSGWFAGGGLDARLAASNWFLRLEYRFSQFDSETVFPIELADVGVDVEPTVHSARLTLTYKFPTGYGWGNGWGGWSK